MRPNEDRTTLHEMLRATHRSLASLLLAGAMLAPVAEFVAGWAVHTPLGVPLLAHVALLATLSAAATGATVRPRNPRERGWLRWLFVAPVAATLAAILHARANAFYTERALIEGMAVLFTLRIGVIVLRRRALRWLGLAAADGHPPFWWRQGAEWRRRLGIRSLRVTPGVHLADVLTAFVGWLLLATWILIALAHRHPAGPLLLLAGAIELLTLLVLVPDALARPGFTVVHRPYAASHAGGTHPPSHAGQDTPYSNARILPMFRRKS